MIPYKAFTVKSDKGQKLRQLITPVIIESNGNQIQILALWDTGASGTCLSKDVAAQMQLCPIGKQTLGTAGGKTEVNRYLVDISLPNQVRFNFVPVCDADLGGNKIDALIGMDIIGQGDFAVTNYEGRTVFSFRIPSKQHIDFVDESDVDNKDWV